MRCKQGDLAVIVKSGAGNEGKVVRCLEFLGDIDGFEIGGRWRIDQTVWTRFGELVSHVADRQLKPLRNTDGEDEMLTIIKRKQSDLVGK